MVMFAKHIVTTSQGGSSYVNTAGVSVSRGGNDIEIRPIKTNGDNAANIAVQLPMSAVAGLIGELLTARDGVYQMWDTETEDFVLELNGRRREFTSPGKVYDAGNMMVDPTGQKFGQTRYVPRLLNPGPAMDAPELAREMLRALVGTKQNLGDTPEDDDPLRTAIMRCITTVLPDYQVGLLIREYIEEKNARTK